MGHCVQRQGKYGGNCARERGRNHRGARNAWPYHMLVSIPPNEKVSSFMGYLKGKSTMIIFERYAHLKYKYGNRHFWSRGYYGSTSTRFTPTSVPESEPINLYTEVHEKIRRYESRLTSIAGTEFRGGENFYCIILGHKEIAGGKPKYFIDAFFYPMWKK